MRAKGLERRGRQKITRPPSYRIENEYNPEAVPQYFQVSVNVLEARKLAWSNPQYANSYVIVVLGKKKHRTSIRRSMEEPYYREYFVFELYMSIRDVQRSSLWLAVMEPRCCAPPRLLGEATIDLGAIWAQPHHQVYHKWAQLSLPRDQSAGPVGFLKVDISIVFRGEVQVMPVIASNEKLEDNLLVPSGSEQQRANYVITIYAAFGLPNGTPCHGQGDRRNGKAPSTFVRISFCGLAAKTAVQHRTNNPMYCEQVSIVEMFPNMNQMIRLEVCSAEGVFNRFLGSRDLRLGQISHDGENGFLPTFGPSLLHMYGNSCASTLGTTGEDGPYHRGALLVSLRTIVPYYQQGLRSVNVEPVTPIQPEHLWIQEEFCIFCPVLEVSMLDRRITGKYCGVAITIGDIPGDKRSDEDFETMMYELKSRKLHYTGPLDVVKCKPAYGYIEFANAFPVLQLATRLPDFRFRMYRNNMVYGIVGDLEQVLTEVERRLQSYESTSPKELMDELNKAWDDAMGNILKFLDIIHYSSHTLNHEDKQQQYNTELDQKQLDLQKEEMEKIYQNMLKRTKANSTMNLIEAVSTGGSRCGSSPTKKMVKALLAEIKCLSQNLSSIIYKTCEGWPDIVVWLLNNGSRVAFSKISTADIIYSVIPEQCGRNCGRIQTIYMKPLKCPKHVNTLASGCFCVAGKVELLFWMGLYRQKSAFESYLPGGYYLKVKDYDMHVKTTSMMVECRAFIYRAKLICGIENACITYPFVRINVFNTAKETKVKQKTSSPIWNQVLRIQRLIFTTPERITLNPPIVMVEIYDSDMSGKTDLIGRFQVQPNVDDRQGYEFAPKLQWYDVYKGVEYTGQVLMSIQILQVPERLLKSTVYSPIEEIFYASNEFDMVDEDVEPLPLSLIPKSSTFKVDVYWWGLRDVNITRKPCVVLEIDELTIKSDIIADKKSNTNFPNGRTSQLFESPLNEMYSPPLSIRLYDSSTFGRTLYLGTNVVKNPNKYVVNWLPKTERDMSLKSISIISPNFCQVTINQVIVTRKSIRSFEESADELSSNISVKSSLGQSKVKRSKWRRLFSSKEPDEEEYTLLPVYAKEKDQIKVVRKIPKLTDYKNWWLRFSCSQEDFFHEDNKINDSESITVYNSELESQPEFSKFKDWCATLKLYNGKKTGIPEKDGQLLCGYLKAGIAIYRWPPPDNTVAVSLNGVDLMKGYFDDHPSNDPTKFLVRVYMIKGLNLMVKDFTGKSDPYVVISCGKKHLGDRNNYKPNTVDPIFGKMYEFRCSLPEDYLLTVSLYDYDAIPPDELIGNTSIDLEDRVYSKHRARVGLPAEYNLTGPSRWRDCLTPSMILEQLCSRNHLPPPVFPDSSSVLVNGIEYRDNAQDTSYSSPIERKETLCLSLLQQWHTMPICGHHLVPEHVETRSLYNPDKPGYEQGRVQLWLDIFPLNAGMKIPPPVDIDPERIEEYELRVIVWDVHTKMDNTEHSGKIWKTADVYVKAWIGPIDCTQYTDVHYNIVNGEANFNWRMIFHFLYQHSGKKLVVKEQGPFTECEEYSLPILAVQVLEGDADEFLGSLSLNLNFMPRGTKLARHCTLQSMEKAKRLNLFSVSSMRAWWPLKTVDLSTGQSLPAGVIDLELTLLPCEKAIHMPVGLGRESPSPLPEPKRFHNSGGVIKKWVSSVSCALEGKGYTILLIIIAISIVLTTSYLLYLVTPFIRKWLRRCLFTKPRSHPKHAEGIIRTLYPLRP